MQLFTDVIGKGTYATRERAVKKIEDLLLNWELDVRYLIMATPDGRFAPVVIPTKEQQYLCNAFAHNGICVAF